ncbi:MAG TPA: hypothetical protein ENJ45_06370, partial [Phaeodactylibacter sp.]|nr:hypothetical protein [Phaeodactylibacter sp.]
MIRLQKLSFRIFLLLLLHFCTASFPQPLTAQDKVLPDSLMAYRQMIDQCLRGDKAMNITADDWEKLKAFLSPFQNKKLSDRERNYLSISYFGYLALQDGHADKAL